MANAKVSTISALVIIVLIAVLLVVYFVLINKSYAIGDRGPGGGIVFYITDDGKHGLEASPADVGTGGWGCMGDLLEGADAEELGTGAQNTSDIILDCPEKGIAARLADEYTLNGYDDWYLPSKDELNLLYEQKDLVGGFEHNIYWSSTEAQHNTHAWFQIFLNGKQNSAVRSVKNAVRAVRSF